MEMLRNPAAMLFVLPRTWVLLSDITVFIQVSKFNSEVSNEVKRDKILFDQLKVGILTYYRPVLLFYTPWKLRGIEKQHRAVMG